ncbi:hypothetical protein MTO96_005855 [Rhipicephalus appendiculatus]
MSSPLSTVLAAPSPTPGTFPWTRTECMEEAGAEAPGANNDVRTHSPPAPGVSPSSTSTPRQRATATASAEIFRMHGPFDGHRHANLIFLAELRFVGVTGCFGSHRRSGLLQGKFLAME